MPLIDENGISRLISDLRVVHKLGPNNYTSQLRKELLINTYLQIYFLHILRNNIKI